MVAACFVLLTCVGGFPNPASWSCAVDVQKAREVHKYRAGAVLSIIRSTDMKVTESVEEVVKKFKQECGR